MRRAWYAVLIAAWLLTALPGAGAAKRVVRPLDPSAVYRRALEVLSGGTTESDATPAPTVPAARAAVPGQIVVAFADATTSAAARVALASIGLRTLDIAHAPGMTLVLADVGTTPVEQALAAARTLPGVRSASPNLLRRAVRPWRVPDDPLYAQPPGQAWYYNLIGAPAAWDLQQGSPDVVVAVLDDGADLTHPDLATRYWTNPKPGAFGCPDDVHGCNFAAFYPGIYNRCDYTTPIPNDNITSDDRAPDEPWHGHGVFVAGVIGAVPNNGIGVAGLDWNARVMPVKVFDCLGQFTTVYFEAQAILYAAQAGAAVINMSFGDPLPSDVEHDAIRVAHDQYGVTLVAAAGNGDCIAPGTPRGRRPVDYPAAYPEVIAVTASGGPDAPRSAACFADLGPQVALAAPGVQIVSTIPGSLNGGRRYQAADGTSFAAPLVSAAAALLKSQNSMLFPEQVRVLLRAGASPADANPEPGWAGAGILNVAAALRRVPATFYGRVVSDAPVQPGSPVYAYIDGKPCGAGATFTLYGAPVYLASVDAAATTPGCGTPGASVHFQLGSTGIQTGGAWSPAARQLDLVTGNAADLAGLVSLYGVPAPDRTAIVASAGGVRCGDSGSFKGSYRALVFVTSGACAANALLDFTVGSLPAITDPPLSVVVPGLPTEVDLLAGNAAVRPRRPRCVPQDQPPDTPCSPFLQALWDGSVAAWSGLSAALGGPSSLSPPVVLSYTIGLRAQAGDLSTRMAVARALSAPLVVITAVYYGGPGDQQTPFVEVTSAGPAPAALGGLSLLAGGRTFAFAVQSLPLGAACRVYFAGAGNAACAGSWRASPSAPSEGGRHGVVQLQRDGRDIDALAY